MKVREPLMKFLGLYLIICLLFLMVTAEPKEEE